jgi:hypothetical protein
MIAMSGGEESNARADNGICRRFVRDYYPLSRLLERPCEMILGRSRANWVGSKSCVIASVSTARPGAKRGTWPSLRLVSCSGPAILVVNSFLSDALEWLLPIELQRHASHRSSCSLNSLQRYRKERHALTLAYFAPFTWHDIPNDIPLRSSSLYFLIKVLLLLLLFLSLSFSLVSGNGSRRTSRVQKQAHYANVIRKNRKANDNCTAHRSNLTTCN